MYISGSVVGTGAAISVGGEKCGFRPSRVELHNVTGNCKATWTDSMADASMQKTVDSGGGTTDISTVSSGGITPAADGFTIGTDTDLNVSEEIIHWTAWN